VPATSPLRILHLYPKSDYFTGAAIQMLELATGLAGRGHHVVLATRPGDIWTREALERGLVHCPLPSASTFDLPSVRALARTIREHRIQVVHAHKGKTLAILAALLVPLPVLIANRGVSFAIGRLQAFGYATGRVTAVVAVCKSIKRGLVAAGVPATKIEVIYSGTDIDRFHPDVDGTAVRKELGLGPDDVLITQIGVRSTKGNDDLVDAMAVIAPRAPHACLVVVGARDPRALLERARARGLGHAIRVLGYRKDIPEILRASCCCVDASHAGLGITGALREALAVETAVVATDLEGNGELIRDGVTGLLVAPRDVAGLAAAILRLIADREYAAALGRAGRQLVVSRFSTRIKVERIEALYHRLLDGDPTVRSSVGS
jgi:glycosyltransferase involved in cell wall biosynthesis